MISQKMSTPDIQSIMKELNQQQKQLNDLNTELSKREKEEKDLQSYIEKNEVLRDEQHKKIDVATKELLKQTGKWTSLRDGVQEAKDRLEYVKMRINIDSNMPEVIQMNIESNKAKVEFLKNKEQGKQNVQQKA